MQYTEKIIWCDEMGFPYTIFRDKISFIKYRTIQEKFYKLDDWLYVSDTDWHMRFDDSKLHAYIYDEVYYDHIWDLDNTKIYVINSHGETIAKFTSFRKCTIWSKEFLDSFVYKGWIDNYRPFKSNGKIVNEDKREPISVWDHNKPMTRSSAKFGEVFFTTHPRFYPKMGLNIYYDSPDKDSNFYLPYSEYEDRHELHLKSNVFVN